ncbi:MAG TPA: YciI family protein [Candidatus Tumulicola sp.]|nr:YciI family protein [Candidatus Tumulicola sp.]
MVIVPGDKNSEAGLLPPKELFAEMGRYNEELRKAGVLLEADGLQPTSKGAKVKFDGAKRTVIDGPFTEAKELIAGFWIFEVKSKQEAIEWVKRAPFDGGVEIEIRQIFELSDFPPEIQGAREEARR